jgi:4-coumarate--CoA ligase
VSQRSTRLALELAKRGVTSRGCGGTVYQSHSGYCDSIIGSFYLGAKVANLDPSLSARQTTHLLSLVSPRVIFVEEESVALIEESLQSANLEAEIVVFGKSGKYPVFADFVKPKHR